MPETAKGMKIMLFDAESFPNISYTWGTYDQNVIKVKERRIICSLSWQWYPEKKVHTMALPDFAGYDPKKRDNSALIEMFKAERQKADVAIGHNINRFDDPMVNTDMFLKHISPNAPYRTIDTLQVIKHRFRLNSNKLGDVCEELKIGKKLPHPGFSMWDGCMEGDPKSWDQMRKYNAWDVGPLLRGLYEHVRPWMTRHPNMAVENPGLSCPNCASKRVKMDGSRHTQAGTYRRVLCLDCRAWFRGVVVRGQLVGRTHS